MSDSASPVWARRANKGGGGLGGLITGLMFLLALFGVLVLVLAGMNSFSFTKAGATIDGWIGSVSGHSAPAAAPAK